MANTSYSLGKRFTHYHVLQTESAREMPSVDNGYFRLAEARHYVDDMLKRIVQRGKNVDPLDTWAPIATVLGDIRRDWQVQVVGVSAWRDIIKGYIIPDLGRYGANNLDNTYYTIKRCYSVGCKGELHGHITEKQTEYIQWYDRLNGTFSEASDDDFLEAIDLTSIEVEVTEAEIDAAINALPNGINYQHVNLTPLDDIMHGNDVTLGHYY